MQIVTVHESVSLLTFELLSLETVAHTCCLNLQVSVIVTVRCTCAAVFM